MRTVQFIKYKMIFKYVHQNFNTFIDMNLGCSVEVFLSETFFCKGRFVMEI